MDASELKRHCLNRWPEILVYVAGIDFKLLDGREHPCPKCGGNTRFRLVDKDAGAVRCSHCFSTRCGDGLAAIQWMTGCDLPTAINRVADYIGIANPHSHSHSQTNKKKLQLSQLQILPFDGMRLALWCSKKRPVKPGAAIESGALLATHTKQAWLTIAFPVQGQSYFANSNPSHASHTSPPAQPVGYILYPASGRTLPVFGPPDPITKKIKPPEWKKVKLLGGSGPGYAGLTSRLLSPTTTHVILCEGLPDALAIASDDNFPPHFAAITNANGAGKMPSKWMVDVFRDRTVYVAYDNSEAGQRGAVGYRDSRGEFRPGWCQFIASTAKEVRNVVIPTPIDPATGAAPHDPDLRDWLNFSFGSFMQFLDMAESAPIFQPHDAATPKDQGSEQSDGNNPSESIAIKIPFDNPQRLAKLNLKFYRDTHTRDLKYWKESWYAWHDGRYEEVSSDHLKSRLTSFIESEFIRACEAETIVYNDKKKSPDYDPAKDKGPPKLRPVTKAIVDSTYQATKSICLLKNSQIMNSWIELPQELTTETNQPKFEAEDTCIAVKNGILNLTKLIKLIANESDENPINPDDVLTAHSPNWFSKTRLPYDFDPNILCPTWLKFLEQVTNNDESAISLLQKWFGYLVSGETNQQKILFVIGEKRSGKGTIARTIKDLFGEENVCTPTLGDFQRQFSLESMVGKTVGLITDARMPDKADETAVTEQLLAITGEDSRDVQRKYKTALAGHKLPIRFTLFSNLLPKFRDISSAFISRCRFILMPNSYEGREDFNLQNKLRAELSGIFNWALIGKKELDKTNILHQPKSGRTLLNQFKDQTANVSVFLEKCCVVSACVDPDGKQLTVPVKELHQRWLTWCEEYAFDHPGTIQNFSRKLRALKPFIDIKTTRTPLGTVRLFLNIALKSEFEIEDAEINGNDSDDQDGGQNNNPKPNNLLPDDF